MFAIISAGNAYAKGDFVPSLGIDYLYDDNYLKLDRGAADSARNTEDSIFKIKAGFEYSFSGSKQTFGVRIDSVESLHNINKHLNGMNYGGEVFLSSLFSSKLTGEAKLSSNRSMSTFGPVLQRQRNDVLTDTLSYELKIRPTAKLYLSYGVGATKRTNSTEENRYLDSDKFESFAKAAYSPSAKVEVSLGYTLSSFKPSQDEVGQSEYQQSVASSGLTYSFSSKTNVEVAFSQVKQEGDFDNQRTFSKSNYALKFNWMMSSKSYLSIGLQNSFLSPETEFSTYTTSKGISLDYAYAVTNKLSIVTFYSQSKNESDLTINKEYYAVVETDVESMGIELTYTLPAAIKLQLQLSRLDKVSDQLINNYSSDRATLSLNKVF